MLVNAVAPPMLRPIAKEPHMIHYRPAGRTPRLHAQTFHDVSGVGEW